ncbi:MULTISPECIES: DUF3899 domain-containing protein [Heyndrickxia]|uniref:Uncharacterized protein n=1 Tax=Heyndrickxia coagulans TaxID=1398 RepID=A0A150K0L3_HEYCO|nr:MULTISPECIES: DUF3899 domain-containing protein [Heyndrickxia]AEH52885.1 hypothetical protein BCO26_0826 [Heyndrickxia coagulans 2-6]APB35599.1 hypothetical protein BIZ35_01525 [Heyndrickxia coagulans]KGT38361.1 hypothetical protein P421_10485 [Heyndrickxia coagulans P38]KYC60910.1 hypothetical protein B4098_0310 [Heyndrickxia coagulans]KYC63113.1 hypothetical protein B4100_0273 [Heyndrickxia coagulans]
MFKKLVCWFLASQLLVLLFSFLVYKRIDLLSYINTSFTIGALLILFAASVLMARTGFFDAFIYGFQRMSSKFNEGDVRPLSKLVTLRVSVPLLTGVFMMVLMAIALFLQSSS